MRAAAICAVLLAAACNNISLPGDEQAAANACRDYSGLHWYTTSNDTPPNSTFRSNIWRLDVHCRDATFVQITRTR